MLWRIVVLGLCIVCGWCTGSPAQSQDLSDLFRQIDKLREDGRASEAIPLAQQALARAESIFGRENPGIAVSLDKLGGLLHAVDRNSEAEPLLRRALSLREHSHGPDHLDVAISLANLSSLLIATDRTAEAEVLMRRAVAIRERALGSGHPDVAASLSDLALLLQRTNRSSEAEPLVRRALAINETQFGPNHDRVATSLHNLSNLLQSTNRLFEAELLERRALSIWESSRPPDHPDIAVALDSLGQILQATNRTSEAEPFLRRALAIRETHFGIDHSVVALSLNNLAHFYYSVNRPTEAEPLMRRALAIYEARLGKEHSQVASALGNLAQFIKEKDPAEAEGLMRRALDISQKLHGIDDVRVSLYLNNLAEFLMEGGRTSEAEPLMRRSLYLREQTLAADHPDIALSLNNLAELLRTTGRAALAEPLMLRALSIYERALGAEHPMVATVLQNLATLFAEQKDWPRTLAFIRRATKVAVAPTGGETADRAALSKLELAFGLHVIALDHAAPQGSAADDESFRVAQWALQTAAGEALAQMAARFTSGQGSLANLVRERQDILGERSATNAKLLAAEGSANAPETARLHATLGKLEARIRVVEAQLNKTFPDYATLSNPQPTTIAATQALLRPDEVLVQFLVVPAIGNVAEATFVWAVTKSEVRWMHLDVPPTLLAQAVSILRCGLDEESGWRWDESAGKWIGLYDGCQALALGGRAKSEVLPFHVGMAHQIYRALFGPIANVIKDKQLLLVPSGPLTSLPIGVLVTAEPKVEVPNSIEAYRGIRWLAREHAITVLPSVGSLASLRRYAKESHADRPFAGFGNPLLSGSTGLDRRAWERQTCPQDLFAPGSRLASLHQRHIGPFRRGVTDMDSLREQPPLPETSDEICAIGRGLLASSEDLFLGARATEATIKQLSESGQLKRYRVLHFATHGLLPGQTEQLAEGLLEPALLLTPPASPTASDDGLLTASEVAQLKLDADWVILSACNTASGDKPNAEALSGFARAFFYAGARSLLVSHWPVDTDSAVTLTTGAFKAMAEAAPTATPIGRAEALRRSIVATMDGNASALSAHPSAWAPFVLVGEGGR